MKVCGIYCLISPSGKKYIGQSMNIKRRLTQYKRGENKNQSKIHAAINKYGWENFKIEILFTIRDLNNEKVKAILNNIEKFFIRKFSSVEQGYNLTYGGDSFLLSEETKLKISKGKKGQGLGVMKNNKPILQYTKSGEFIREWDAINYAGLELKIDPSSISCVCRGLRKSAGGYVWKYR